MENIKQEEIRKILVEAVILAQKAEEGSFERSQIVADALGKICKVFDGEVKEENKSRELPKGFVVMSFGSYNDRRYSLPWIATIKDGKYDFTRTVGYYSGNKGEAGDLIISEPQENVIYAYGQKDNRGNCGFIKYGKFIDGRFVDCDKAGKDK